MADQKGLINLHQQLADAISQNITADTNYWGEYEQLNKESLLNAAAACELALHDFTKNIAVSFAAWVAQELLTGDLSAHFVFFIKNIYQQEPSGKPASAVNLLR